MSGRLMSDGDRIEAARLRVRVERRPAAADDRHLVGVLAQNELDEPPEGAGHLR